MKTIFVPVKFVEVGQNITFFAKSHSQQYCWIKICSTTAKTIDKKEPTIRVFGSSDIVLIEKTENEI